jgi:hypothetical protein
MCLFYLLLKSKLSFGFELNTHAALSERAVVASTLNNFLTGTLGFEFPSGINQPLKAGQFGRVRDLISEVGAKNEDKPAIRSRFHFHDPLQPWDNAGLRWPLLGQVGQSSVLWSQNTDQGMGGKHSWQDARNSYFNALTATNEADRKKYFAETFESLGHLIHLVQDAATPSHTRNDTHISFDLGLSGYTTTIGDPDRFHQWANRPTIVTSIANPNLPAQTFDSSLLELPQNGLAPIPIARIIDTEAYRGSGVPATPSSQDNIGIAEYSNGNFFSDDTILTGYNYPAASSMDLVPEAVTPGGPFRFYLRKNRGPGAATGYRAAVASRLSGYVPLGFGAQQWELDDNVMADYGALLFPRAIGYSAGLIDYFFRNHMVGNAGDIGCFGPPPPPNNPYYDNFGLGVGTGIPGEQPGSGRIVVVVHYTYAGQDNYFTLLDTTATLDPELGAGWLLSSQPLYQIPLGASEVYFVIAYRGPLGQETDAVVGGYGFFWGVC